MTSPEPAVEPLAEDALLLRFGDGIDIETNARVHAAARTLRKANLPGVTDIAPAYASLLLRFEPLAWKHDALIGTLRGILEAHDGVAPDSGFGPGALPRQVLRRDDEHETDTSGNAARVVEIPVCYGGDFGPDLEAVAAHARMTPDAAIAHHATAEYTVAMLGFAPGFPYLLGLDPALHMTRRATPRTHVPAGSVGIGGAQTGIYPCELPGGWQLIGRTPRVLFDPQREPPCLLAPGDKVRFRAIDGDEFEALARPAT
jgi:KipI family sensor histidine kinase inhibitor